MVDYSNGHAVLPERPDAIRADAGHVPLNAIGRRAPGVQHNHYLTPRGSYVTVTGLGTPLDAIGGRPRGKPVH
jgi:hypothetical protein